MNARIRQLAFCASYVVVLALSLWGVRFACSPGSWSLEAVTKDWFSREFNRRRLLEEAQVATLQRRQAQRQVVEEWLAGRLSLAEAIASWRLRLRANTNPELPGLELPEEVDQEEAIVQRMHLFVAEILQGRPAEAKVATGRMQREHEALHAGPRLPSPPAMTVPLTGWLPSRIRGCP
jgi:hypothetical protein